MDSIESGADTHRGHDYCKNYYAQLHLFVEYFSANFA